MSSSLFYIGVGREEFYRWKRTAKSCTEETIPEDSHLQLDVILDDEVVNCELML